MTDLEPPAASNTPSAVKQSVHPSLLKVLGPGLITGASDDDPSGIAKRHVASAELERIARTLPRLCCGPARAALASIVAFG